MNRTMPIKWQTSTSALVSLSCVILGLAAGCGGGQGPTTTIPSERTTAEHPTTTGEVAAGETKLDLSGSSGIAPAESRAPKPPKKYDYIDTLRGPFGARGQDDPAALRQATISGDISGSTDSGQVNLKRWYWKITPVETPPASDQIKSAISRTGTHLVRWSKTDGKLTATVTGPATVYFNNGPAKKRTISGQAEVQIIDAAAPGRTGDKVRVRFTGGEFNNALLFSVTTDSSQGRDKAEIALLRDSPKPPK